MEVIHKLAQTKTIILISHRLANVVNSDCIYMLKNGKITEKGNHSELMNKMVTILIYSIHKSCLKPMERRLCNE